MPRMLGVAPRQTFCVYYNMIPDDSRNCKNLLESANKLHYNNRVKIVSKGDPPMKHTLLKRIVVIMLIFILAVGLVVPVGAAVTEYVDITYRAIKIKLNGEEITPCDAAGNTVEPFIMNSTGTTYLPLRAIGQALGLDVQWEPATNTVTLASGGEIKTGAGASGTTTGTKKVAITYRDIKVVLDGKQLELNNTAGVTVEPFIMDSTTYLPLRVIGEALGLEVSWDSATSTAILQKKSIDYSEWFINEYPDHAYLNGELIECYIKPWYEEMGIKFGFALITPESVGDWASYRDSLKEKMDVDNESDYIIYLYSGGYHGTFSGGSLSEIFKLAGLIEHTWGTGIDGIYQYFEELDTLLRGINFENTQNVTVDESFFSGTASSKNSDAINDVLKMDIWQKPSYSYVYEFDPETGAAVETDELQSVFAQTKLPRETKLAANISISYSYQTGEMVITAPETLSVVDKNGNILSAAIQNNNGMDENGLFVGTNGYTYDARQIMKQLLEIILPGESEEAYGALKEVFLLESYEDNMCKPSAVRWVDGHCVYISMNPSDHHLDIHIGEAGERTLCYSYKCGSRYDYNIPYVSYVGAENYIRAYELDRW